MKKLLLFTLPLFAMACSSLEEPKIKPTEQSTQTSQALTEPEPDAVKVNSHELKRVINAALQQQNFPKSRATEEYTVDIIPYTEGNPAIYVVNFANNGGFILVSAVKSAYPILAYNTTGHYDISLKDCPLAYWRDVMVDNIENSLTLSADSVAGFKNIWRPYEYQTTGTTKSRTDDGLDNYEDWPEDIKEQYRHSINILMDSVAKWTASNPSEVYWLYESDEIINRFGQGTYDQACSSAQGAIYYRFESLWEQSTIIIVKDNIMSETNAPNFLKTTWGQDFPYNQCFPPVDGLVHAYAGCGPVAIGQIMKYYEWPAKYDWNSMPNNTGNATISNLLFDIVTIGNCTPNSNGTPMKISTANDVFKSMGYSTTNVHDLNNVDQISDYLLFRHPIYLRGVNTGAIDNGKSHAWIASGYKRSTYQKELLLYTIVKPLIIDYDRLETFSSNTSSYIYMNWGWNGLGNGYYYFDNLKPLNGYHFSKNFKYLCPIPNK